MKDILPRRYAFSHDFALFLHDTLVQIVKFGEECKLFHAEYRFASKEEADRFHKTVNGDVWKWMVDNDRQDLLRELTYRQISVVPV